MPYPVNLVGDCLGENMDGIFLKMIKKYNGNIEKGAVK